MKKKMAIFVPNVNQGGTERVAQRLANYFSSKDIIVTIWPYILGFTINMKLERALVIPVPLTVRVIQAYLHVRLIVRQVGVVVKVCNIVGLKELLNSLHFPVMNVFQDVAMLINILNPSV